jgi:hypothetical protein
MVVAGQYLSAGYTGHGMPRAHGWLEMFILTFVLFIDLPQCRGACWYYLERYIDTRSSMGAS